MRAVDLIYAKRQGRAIPQEAIRELISEYVHDHVPDYQMSAFLMAVCFQGLDSEELAGLVDAMMSSGECFDLSALPGHKSDKHSTGGVGDKVSLILAPLAAACGLVVPMVSGRGLGHTGGTLDKLESIEGFNVFLETSQFKRILKKIGVCMLGQTSQFVPADKKLYALRDVTATVESIPLISASIMSKKMAEGCESLVLDLKVGNGAFMRTLKDARLLGQTMLGIGQAMGREVRGVITDMNQPLGRMIGNANEVIESIDYLKGLPTSDDLKKVTEALTAEMLLMGKVVHNHKQAQTLMNQAIASGKALEVFRKMIEAQGGDPKVIDDYRRFPTVRKYVEICSPKRGYLSGFECREVGLACVELGGGRATKEDSIDPAVGIEVLAKVGDKIDKGQPIFKVHYRQARKLEAAQKRLENAFSIHPKPCKPLTLIHQVLK